MKRHAKTHTKGSDSGIGRALPVSCVALLALLALAFSAAPALAASGYSFASQIGSGGSGAGQFELSSHNSVTVTVTVTVSGVGISGVAVNSTTHDVYVADTGNARVDEFSSLGAFIRAWGWGVADGSNAFQTCTATCQAGIHGAGAGQFTDPTFIAVDNSATGAGDVYVADKDSRVVQRFDSEGNYISSNDGSASGSLFHYLDGIAVDPTGHLWAYDGEGIESGILREFAQDGSYVAGSKFTSTGSDLGQVTPDADNNAKGLAVDPSTDDLYVAQYNGNTITHFTRIEKFDSSCNPVLGPCAVAESFGSDSEGMSAAGGLAVDSSNHDVYAVDSGAGGFHGAGEKVAVFSLPTSAPPAVDSTSVTDVGTSSATLGTQIKPNGLPTTYHFEYVDDATCQADLTAHGAGHCFDHAQQAPDPEGPPVGSGTSDLTLSQGLAGLSASTLYDFRAVATNSLDTTDGPTRTFTTFPTPTPQVCPANAAFRTGPAANLSDCRAYEMVSPVDKNGNDAVPDQLELGTIIDSTRSSSSGDGFVFESLGAFAGAQGASTFNNYLSRRGASGWTTAGLTPPIASIGLGYAIGGWPYADLEFTPELTKGVAFVPPGPPLTADAPTGQPNLYLADLGNPASPSYQVITNVAAPNNTPFGNGGRDVPVLEAASADLSHVVFAQEDSLTPGASGESNLYEWSAGQLRLVNVAPNGTPIDSGKRVGGGWRMVSADGSRIFFKGGDGNLYVRENGTSTVQIDASQGAGPGGGGEFLTASVDGSKVFFTDSASAGLTDDTVPGSGTNLYEYDLGTGSLTDLTPTATASVDGLTAASDDGSYVYFVANAVLANTPNSQGDTAQASQPNLYLAHGGTTTFIATLAGSDSSDWLANGDGTAEPGGTPPPDRGPANGPVDLTPDGTHLALQSVRSLTGYDNADASTGEPDSEVYLYDAGSHALVCASCNPSNARPGGPSTIAQLATGGGGGFDGVVTYHLQSLSDNGSRLFFNSQDALALADDNGKRDVYEYEKGRPQLISSAAGSSASTLLDASPSGNDVFFTARDQLLGADQDGLLDIYDARSGGGFAEQ